MNETLVLIGFLVLVSLILMVDIGVFHKKDHEVGFREALVWTAVWVSLALATGVLIYFFGNMIHGLDNVEAITSRAEDFKHPILDQLSAVTSDETAKHIYNRNLALEYITGYLIEYSLSIDNIFVIVLVFYSFGVEKQYYHRVLFWGILGAIVMRFLFIFLSAELIQRFEWILVIFGAFLVFTGVKMFLERKKTRSIDTQNHPVIRFTSRFFRVNREYRGHRFFLKIDGRIYITSLFIVLLVIEFSDVIFAVDSVPAIFSVTKDPYIVYFSNIFAIIGLRSLFFLLINIMEKFRFLHIGLSFLLVFVGIKMILPFIGFLGNIHIPTLTSLFIIIGIIGLSILASLIIPVSKEQKANL
ncbi:MAG: TerC/Alx family metal homeostasis membrane protein [bacterium]